jgi:succinate dehydrogenase/fumarate reductase cytochrome b subunit
MESTVGEPRTDGKKLDERTLIRIQAASGLLFAAFLTLHLLNTILAARGQATYDGYQRVVRWFYQFPLVEIVVVLGAGLVHLGAGAVRILRRRRRARSGQSHEARPTLRVRLHRYSGYYLGLMFMGHAIATRGPGLIGHPADFSFLTFSLRQLPVIFYTYYALFVVAGIYHLVHGVLVGLRVLSVRLPGSATAPRSKPFWAFVGVTSAAGLVGVMALGGTFFTVDTHRFPEWQTLYERFVPPSLRPW